MVSKVEGGARTGTDPRLGRWRFSAALASVAAAAVLAAGCGGDSDDDGGSASAASADSDAAVAFAQCMRENGVPNFPDPENGVFQATDESGIDPDSPEFKQAQQACRNLLPAGAQAGGPPPEDLQAQVLELADCMRKNGVPNFPDPDFSGGSVQLQMPPGTDPEALQQAQQACQKLAPSGLGTAP
jgi:hypothetical protein